MSKPEVWAPAAGAVRFAVGDATHDGIPREGWWACPVEIPHGTEYRIARDDAPAVADPRSVDLPEGFDGPSRVFDFEQLTWTDAGFRASPWNEAVLYELHIGTFTPEGTLDAAIGKLQHLAELGVTHVELMPVHGFAGERGWGYDGVYLFAVHAAYGGPAALARFVDAAHARGLAVILDVVYNHIGPGADRISSWAPYFDTTRETPWGPTFDFTRTDVRRFVCDNALMWLRDFHIDGLRLDAVQTIHDPSDVHILAQLNDEVRAVSSQTGRDYVLVDETVLNERHRVRPRDEDGHGHDAHWHEDFHHAVHAVLTGERAGYYADFGSLSKLAHVMRDGYWFDGSRPSTYQGTSFGEPADGLHGAQLVTYLHNHDQVGNRPDGATLHTLVGHDAAMIGTALTLLGAAVPMLWQGEEWGTHVGFHFFCDHEPSLGRNVRDGRRAELAAFGFDAGDMLDPQDPQTMQACVLDWSERDRPPHASLLSWTRDLLALRRSIGGATPFASVEVSADETNGTLVMNRDGVRVVANFGTAAATVNVQGHRVHQSSKPMDMGPVGQLNVPPRSVAVLVRD